MKVHHVFQCFRMTRTLTHKNGKGLSGQTGPHTSGGPASSLHTGVQCDSRLPVYGGHVSTHTKVCLHTVQTGGFHTGFASVTLMDRDQRASMACPAPLDELTSDLHSHPTSPNHHTPIPPPLPVHNNPPFTTPLDNKMLLITAIASQIMHHIVSQPTTTHPALSTRPGVVLTCPLLAFLP